MEKQLAPFSVTQQCPATRSEFAAESQTPVQEILEETLICEALKSNSAFEVKLCTGFTDKSLFFPEMRLVFF
jgi:hypothetical protein